MLSKAVTRPSAEMEGVALRPLDGAPVKLRLVRVVTPDSRSRTKMSWALLKSAGTRSDDSLENATHRPFPEIVELLKPLSTPSAACAPAELTLARVVVPACRSRTKTSQLRLLSPGTRLLAL